MRCADGGDYICGVDGDVEGDSCSGFADNSQYQGTRNGPSPNGGFKICMSVFTEG